MKGGARSEGRFAAVPLYHDGIGKIVATFVHRLQRVAREVGFQQQAHALQGCCHAHGIVAALESGLHVTDQRLPLLRRQGARQGAVGDDLDGVVGQQQIDQGAVVVLGIPDAQLAEQRDGALARRGIAPDVAGRQAGLDADTDLSCMALLAHGDQALQLRQGLGWECTPQLPFGPMVAQQPDQTLNKACDRSRHLTNSPRRRRPQNCRLPRS